MKKNSHKSKITTYSIITLLLLVAIVCIVYIGRAVSNAKPRACYEMWVSGVYAGIVDSEETAERLLREARRQTLVKYDEMIFMDVELSLKETMKAKSEMNTEQEVLDSLAEFLPYTIMATYPDSYTVKFNELFVSLQSLEEVQQLLQTAVNKYDPDNHFSVQIVQNEGREFSVLAAKVVPNEEIQLADNNRVMGIGGVSAHLRELQETEIENEEKDFSEYETGVLNMDFVEKIEIIPSYVRPDYRTTLDKAIMDIVADQEVPQIYKVQSGDTLSEIAIKVNIPMDEIVAMNESLSDTNAVLQIGQELVVMVPEPTLSVTRTERNYIEEIYDEEVQIIDVDDWFTNQTEVIQQPSAGFRRIIADVTYVNDSVVDKYILKEEVVMEAVPKIVKRGTKIPPTYIKPISGGRFTSGFGKRNAPTKGASTYHKGVDWAIPTGTPIYASCGGTVAKAGWGSGYGYVVYIDHEDGKQTRYGHCSKVLVSAGDKVKQGDKIALSGNTGITTGPHLHFEILVNGSQVNPFNYVSK